MLLTSLYEILIGGEMNASFLSHALIAAVSVVREREGERGERHYSNVILLAFRRGAKYPFILTSGDGFVRQ